MKSLYYFISSLPTLKWASNPPFSVEKFLEIAKSYLSDRQYEILRNVSVVPTSDFENSSAADKWTDWEKFLRRRIAAVRAKNKSFHSENVFASEKGYYFDAEKAAQSAMALENPLEKEKSLDMARWRAIENLFSLHRFDFETLIAYKLKLEIISKYSSLDKTKAAANLNKITEDILKKQEF